jgi:hypothetical protein
MDTAPLRSFATSARTELIREVGARITAVLAQGSPERAEQPRAIAALERAIAAGGGGARGKGHVADKVAYTWFNRIIALRFMDANGYTGIGVVSPAADQVGQPAVLAAAKAGQVDGDVVKTNLSTITGLLNGTRQPRLGVDAQAEAYELLLADYCRYWNKAMPFMFEREGDFTELLIPANLLADDSVLNRSVKVLTEEVCQDVEAIGWLYQFYIAERKDEVFAGFKKNKKAGADEIPAATQLFTPHWIVRYLVENSIGRLWMLNHPSSRLVDQMQYYIAPVDEETDFLKIAGPEDLKVIDPACGSGHMLTYAFDLLYAIYEEEGYTPSQIPSLILTHNLYGTEIDPRAGALAAFALTMKAAARRKLFLKNPVEPNVCVLDPITFNADELSYLVTRDGGRHAEEAFWNQFANADTFGSLIRPDPKLTVRLADHLATLDDEGDILRADALDWAARVIDQAVYLTRDYAVAVANPPYMGSKQMNDLLSQFMKGSYPDSKSDLFAGFIERVAAMVNRHGFMAQVTMQSWMFLSSYEKLRARLQNDASIVAMLHMDNMVMRIAFGTAATVWEIGGPRSRAGNYTYFEVADLDGGVPRTFPTHNDRTAKAGAGGYFTVSQADFAAIPGAPIVYWLSEKMLAAFTTFAALESRSRSAKGLVTADNATFVRSWWEVSKCRMGEGYDSRDDARQSGKRWFPYAKGGEFRRWAGNLEAVVDWENDGIRLQTTLTADGSRVRATNFNLDRILKPAIAWTVVTAGEQSFRSVPGGSLFDAAAGMCQSETDEVHLALLNSGVASILLAAINPTLNLHPGYLGALPVANRIDDLPSRRVSSLVETSQMDWDLAETAWDFDRNPLVALGRQVADLN